MEPFVSIVVATYNRCAGLKRLLHALAAQTYPPDCFEVVVVDDGSTDGTTELLRLLDVPYSVRCLSQPNRGPAAARNRGVDASRGSLIVFLDDDVVPAAGVIAAHVSAHRNATDRVVIGPMLPPPREWPQPAWDRWDAEQLQEQYRAMLAGQFACSQRQFYTANASVQRWMFLEAGGFDSEFKRAEDTELAWRMSGLGARFVFEPSAEVVHYAARPFASWRRNAYQYGRYDVIMGREKRLPVFRLACEEFHHRRAVNRWLTRACVGHPRLVSAAVTGLSGAVRLAGGFGAERIASLALSSIFSLQYWQGASDEVGGPRLIWRAVDARGTTAEDSGAVVAEGRSRRAPSRSR